MEPAAWLDEIDPAPGPPFLRMGTRALTGDWMLGGPDVAGQLAEKRRVLAAHHDEAFAVLDERDGANGVGGLDGLRAASAELLQAVAEQAGAASPPDADLHPLDAAARMVAEDLCLLLPARSGGATGAGGGWVLAGGSVCFPSHWRLRDKLGRPVAAVHAPVPRYAAELQARVDRFLDRMKDGPGVWRRNWTVHTSPALFVPTPPPPPDPPIPPADAGDRLWLRSERQTLRRLPRTGAIVFGIRTQQVLLRALATRPTLCARLADTAAAWPAELVSYRGGEAVRRPLVAWLRTAAP